MILGSSTAALFRGIRDRLSRSIRRASLLGIESIGRAEIYANLHRETVTISQATSTVVMAGQSAVMVTFSLAYLAWLSRAAFFLTVFTTGIAVILHMRRVGALNQLLRQSHTLAGVVPDRQPEDVPPVHVGHSVHVLGTTYVNHGAH